MAETKKQPQKMRFSDLELSLIKNTFLGADDLMRALRKVFLQMPLDAIDSAVLEGIKNNREVLAVIRKSYLPELDANAPLHQLVDLWMTVEIKDKTPEEALPHLMARATLIAYLDQQLQFIEGKIQMLDCKIRLEDLKNIEGKGVARAYSDLIARNTAIAHGEMQLNQFKVLAGLESETVEEMKKRLGADSGQ